MARFENNLDDYLVDNMDLLKKEQKINLIL